ncbi:MAG: hypothetical protein ABT05_03780 [Lautropia sp. SCN 66-9]|nr:MAG: hypothetical protein ABT05_03780 [Lautropia sp. SCN 66-9]
MREAPSPVEGAAVGRHLRAVQLDGALDGTALQRQPTLLPRIADQQRIGEQGIAQQRFGGLGGFDEIDVDRAGSLSNALLQGRLGQMPVGVAQKIGSRHHVAVDHGARHARTQLRQGLIAGRHDQIAADQQIGLAGGDARGEQMLGPLGKLHVREHGAALLRQAGHVEHRHALAFQVRSHAEQLTDGDDTGAADTGDQHAIAAIAGSIDAQRGGFGQLVDARIAAGIGRHAGAGNARGTRISTRRRRQAGIAPLALPRLAQGTALDRDEARAEALQAREILVA